MQKKCRGKGADEKQKSDCPISRFYYSFLLINRKNQEADSFLRPFFVPLHLICKKHTID